MDDGEEPIAEAAYDELADDYAEAVGASAYNADLEFPATTSLVPDVADERVLDAGCGAGRYSEWLAERGAEVVGLDVSEEMLAQAADRVGDRAAFVRGSLSAPLGFDDGEFDGVVSALALGYVRDWRRPFTEFARVLSPGGFLVFSTAHPFDQFPPEDGDDANYFEVERRTKDWDVEVPYYRRPVGEILTPLLETGFRIDSVHEPQPTEEFREKRPERYEKESRYPVFFCVRAVRE